ncbi:MAG: nucleoside triphosphate pyrophosphohydrolase [Oscillochloris sp.]|nr:nucleoside triphosphate pyrophosphohydrolase [Oscillochloris sp.]
MTITRALILDVVAAALEIDPDASVQVLAATTALKRLQRLDGAPEGPLATADRPYSEVQNLGPYTPPALPYPLHPDGFVLIWGAPQQIDGLQLAHVIGVRYPADMPLTLLALAGDGTQIAQTASTLATFVSDLAAFTALIPAPAALVIALPPLAPAANLRTLDGLAWVVARLYGPAGCPWDRRQTHQSLRTALLEEAYEVLEALDADDRHGLSEELGDLLLSVISHAEMARQAGYFRLEDVLAGVSAKLIRRHPHVFADLAVSGEGEVLHNWEQIKAAELAAKGRARSGALDGVPEALPALAAAQKLGKKAARVGFNWPHVDGVWAKIAEELAELRDAVGTPSAAEELGDLLFVLCRLAEWLDLDAETALREANLKFRRRFAFVEAAAGRSLNELSLAELRTLWQQAKVS